MAGKYHTRAEPRPQHLNGPTPELGPLEVSAFANDCDFDCGRWANVLITCTPATPLMIQVADVPAPWVVRMNLTMHIGAS